MSSRTHPAAARATPKDSGVLQRQCACGNHAVGGVCQACQRKALSHGVAKDPFGAVNTALSASGSPLDAATRQFFEPRFGRDFSHVRVQVNDPAAAAVQAQAFTSGHQIVFAGHHYQPATAAGRHLLAHELTHVLQQQSANGPRNGIGLTDDRFERHADAVADRIAAGHSVTGLLPAVTTSPGTQAIQRKGGLLSPEKVGEVYGYWVIELSRARKTGDMASSSVDADARERTKKQVGPANFARWEQWEEGKQQAAEAKAEADNPKKPAKPFNPEADLQTSHAELKAAGLAMSKEVARVEGKAAHLNFGNDTKGAVARATAGGYTVMWGIGGRAVSSAVNRAPMLLLEGAGVGLGSEYAERKLVEETQEIKREGEEMGEDARTGVRLAGGTLQANYNATRPSYKKFMAALSTFTDADIQFGKNAALGGMSAYIKQSGDYATMKTAFGEMREASNEYLMLCAQLGIENDAKALNVLGNHIVKGASDTVGTAVGVMAGELMPSPGELLSALKGPKGMGAKQLEKEAEQVVTSTLQSGEKTAAASAVKSADNVAAGTAAHAPEIKTQSDAIKFVEEHPPAKIEGQPGNRHAKVEGHEIVELPGGGCELHSPKPYMKVPCPWRDGAALPDKPGSVPDPLDEQIAIAEKELNESRQKLTDYKAQRAEAGRSLKGGPSKGVWNAKERLWLLRRQKVYPDRQMLEQVTIVGVKDASGTLKPAKAFGQEGRILDFAEVDGAKVIAGDLKSADELIGSVKGGVNKGPIEGTIKPKSKLGQQTVKEDALVKDAATNKGKLVLQGKDVRTGQTVTVEVDPASFDSTVVTYGDLGGN